MNEQVQVHNDLKVNVFVSHFKVDQRGRLVDEQALSKSKTKEEQKGGQNSDLSDEDYDDEDEAEDNEAEESKEEQTDDD